MQFKTLSAILFEGKFCCVHCKTVNCNNKISFYIIAIMRYHAFFWGLFNIVYIIRQRWQQNCEISRNMLKDRCYPLKIHVEINGVQLRQPNEDYFAAKLSFNVGWNGWPPENDLSCLTDSRSNYWVVNFSEEMSPRHQYTIR